MATAAKPAARHNRCEAVSAWPNAQGNEKEDDAPLADEPNAQDKEKDDEDYEKEKEDEDVGGTGRGRG